MKDWDLDESISYKFVQIARKYRNVANKMLNEHGLHVGQETILYKIKNIGPCTLKELCQNIKISAPSLSKSIRILEDMGLILIDIDSIDHRKKYITLTNEGEFKLNQIIKTWKKLETDLLMNFPSEQKKQMMKCFNQMLNNLMKMDNY